MSLHVDLIYASEQRSGAIVTVKSVGRVTAVIVPIIAAGLVGIMLIRNMQSASARAALEIHWELAEMRQRAAVRLAQDLNRNRRILTELESWSSTALPWANQLYALAEATPPTIQLRQIAIQTRNANPGTRRFTMRLIGSTHAAQASQSIAQLRDAFSTHESWTNRIDNAEIVSFAQDESPGAAAEDRMFTIDVTYRRMEIE